MLGTVAGGNPALTPLESYLTQTGPDWANSRRELVIIHPWRQPLAKDTRRWLELRSLVTHHQVCSDAPTVLTRLAHPLGRRAIGIILGGGGLRAAAPIGAMTALEEAGVPFNVLGGSSAGPISSAQFPLGWDGDRTLSRNRLLFVDSRALVDYALPITSLNAGQRSAASRDETFGDAELEQLELPLDCVSSNRNRAGLVVQRSRLLWGVVRAICSIPGVLTPVNENGDLLINGGGPNNSSAGMMGSACDDGDRSAVDPRVKVYLTSAQPLATASRPGTLSGAG